MQSVNLGAFVIADGICNQQPHTNRHIGEVLSLMTTIYKMQPGLRSAGVALINDEAGQIVALISAPELASAQARKSSSRSVSCL